jgi:hypothetical protein
MFAFVYQILTRETCGRFLGPFLGQDLGAADPISFFTKVRIQQTLYLIPMNCIMICNKLEP